MAATTYPFAQQGSFCFDTPHTFTGAVFTAVQHSKQQEAVDVTGTRLNSSGTCVQDTSKQWQSRTRVDEFVASGYVEETKTYALAQSCTLTLSALVVRVGSFRLRKVWPLVNITNTSTAEWQWGIPIYSLTLTGWAKESTGPVTGTSRANATFSMDTIGTVDWNNTTTEDFVIENITTSVPLGQGGGVPVQVSGVMQGDVDYSAGSNDFGWLFIDSASTADDPLKLVGNLDTDAETISSSCLLYDHTFTCPIIAGGPVQYDLRMRWDKA